MRRSPVQPLAVLDTGYTGAICLPESFTATLPLGRLIDSSLTDAQGIEHECKKAELSVAVSNESHHQKLSVQFFGVYNLVGLAAIHNHQVSFSVQDNEPCTIEPNSFQP